MGKIEHSRNIFFGVMHVDISDSPCKTGNPCLNGGTCKVSHARVGLNKN